MIRCVETGRNPTLRYLHRTHRLRVSWLHERFQDADLNLVYEVTSRMCADIYTKAFTDGAKWEAACWLINVVDPRRISGLIKVQDACHEPPPPSGGPSTTDGIQALPAQLPSAAALKQQTGRDTSGQVVTRWRASPPLPPRWPPRRPSIHLPLLPLRGLALTRPLQNHTGRK